MDKWLWWSSAGTGEGHRVRPQDQGIFCVSWNDLFIPQQSFWFPPLDSFYLICPVEQFCKVYRDYVSTNFVYLSGTSLAACLQWIRTESVSFLLVFHLSHHCSKAKEGSLQRWWHSRVLYDNLSVFLLIKCQKIPWSPVPRAQSDFFKFLVLPERQSKNPEIFKWSKAAKSSKFKFKNILKTGIKKCLVFLISFENTAGLKL